MTSKGKTGMKELMDIVLGLKQDVKRMNSLISPQGAQSLVEKHNHSNPNSRWALKKLDVNGPAVLNNMPDVNNDGVPDVIIVDKNNNPVYANGYTTVQSDWPNTLAYHSTYPDKASRAEYKRRHDGKAITKRGFINDTLGVTYFDYDSAQHPEQIRQVGTVIGTNLSQTPQWYQNVLENPKSGYRMKKPRKQSAYEMFNKYVFTDAFNAAIAQIEEVHHTTIPGQHKMVLHSKLCGSYWKSQIKAALNLPDDIPDDQFDKIKRKKNSQPSIENKVYSLMLAHKDNVNTHAYDTLYYRIIRDICQILNLELTPALQPPANYPDPDSLIAHRDSFMGPSSWAAPPSAVASSWGAPHSSPEAVPVEHDPAVWAAPPPEADEYAFLE